MDHLQSESILGVVHIKLPQLYEPDITELSSVHIKKVEMLFKGIMSCYLLCVFPLFLYSGLIVSILD